jgi:hypothetical protein
MLSDWGTDERRGEDYNDDAGARERNLIAPEPTPSLLPWPSGDYFAVTALPGLGRVSYSLSHRR